MIRNSPIDRQNLSTATAKLASRGSRLINSASAAVAQGTQLSNAVASRAVARAEEVVAHVRSPDKMKRTPKGGRTRASGGRGRGIRDRINKFDSASKGDLEYQSTTPLRRRKGSNGSPSGHSGCRRGGGGTEIGMMPLVPTPHKLNFRGKENDPNRDSSDSSLDNFEWKRDKEEAVSHPVNPCYRENEAEPTTMRDEWKRDETEAERSESRESRNGHGSRREDDRRVVTKGVKLFADPNCAAVTRGSRTNDSNTNANSNGDTDACGVQRSKKRGKTSHSLISSPLWSHIRRVHDSACSNATCTIRKDPFPLLPPECTNPLAAVANWEEGKGRDEGSPGGVSNSGIGHLGTLGSVTGNWKGSGVGSEKGATAAAGGLSAGDGSERKDGEEAALDLLTSAAFLFQHSRRKLS